MAEIAGTLGDIGSFISSIVVVLTLVYLATQVRQTNRLIRHQGRHSSIELHTNGLIQMMGQSESIRRVFFGDGATAKDRTVAMNWLIFLFRTAEFEWRQTQEGFLDEETLALNLWPVVSALRNPNLEGWWSAMRPAFEPSFVQHVEAQAVSLGATSESEPWMEWVDKGAATPGGAED